MAVIVTGMDMPVKCGACPGAQYLACKEWVSVGRDSIERSRTCPLKSVDGLIAEIYDKFMTVDGGLHDKTAKKCIEIIREYCGEGKE